MPGIQEKGQGIGLSHGQGHGYTHVMDISYPINYNMTQQVLD